jgi:hypothetical protein
VATVVAGCGGGGGGTSGGVIPKVAPPVGSAAPNSVKLTVHVIVPGSQSTSNARLRHIYSVASNTQSLEIAAYPVGNHTTPIIPPSEANIAAGSGNCGASDQYGNRTCTISIQAPIGSYDFVFTTYDGWTGSAVSGNVIGTGLDGNVTIATGTSPSINATLNSVLATASVSLFPQTIHSIVAQTIAVGITALDADNDVIVAPAWYDASGNQVTLTLNQTNTSLVNNYSLIFPYTYPATPAPSYPVTSLASPVPLAYNGNAQSPTTTSVQITLTSSSGGITTNPATLNFIYPSFTSVTDNNLNVTGQIHGGAVFDTGFPNPKFIYTTQNETIDELDVATQGVSTFNGSPAAGYYGGEAIVGTNLYFVAQSGLYSAPLGSLSSVSNACTSNCQPSNQSGLGYDALNGYLYFTSGINLVQHTIAGGGESTANINAVPVGGVAVDHNSNIWVAQNGASAQLLEVTNFSAATVSAQYLYSGSNPFDVVVAGNGDIVASDKQGQALWVYNGSFYPTYVPCCSSGAPAYLAADPAQPNIVWFDYSGGGPIGIGRFDIATGAITSQTYTGGPGFGQPGAIAVSNNGGIAMVFDGANTVVEVQP